MSLCRNLKSEYESLQKLTTEFVLACKEGGDPRTLSADQLRTLQIKKQALEQARDALKNKLFISPEAAEKIMGIGSYFGPEAVTVTHGVELNKTDLPHIPWNTQELAEAKDRGMMLILRIDKDANGNFLTAETMNNHCQPLLDQKGKGKALRSIDWYKDEPIYTTETPRAGWALVSKEPIPATISHDYVEQTTLIIDHITTTLLNNKNVKINHKERTAYQDAINQWNQYIKDTFFDMDSEQINKKLRGPKWVEYTKKLSTLSITQLTRQSFIEAFSDILTVALNTADHCLLESMYTWTSSRSLSGDLVSVGFVGDSGAIVGGWSAGGRNSSLGVLFARRGPSYALLATEGRPGVSS